MSPQAQIVYKSIVNRFEFLMKQQWATTNYVVLLYAAIAWIGQKTPQLICALSAITVIAGFVATGLLFWFQYDLGKLRERADQANARYFLPDERDALGISSPNDPYTRGWHVVGALISVCLVGALLLVIFLVHLPS